MTARTSFRLRDIHDRTDRACIGADTELFFVGGDDPDLLEPARERCRRCPVVTACLLYALTHDVDGIWGGTTPREREQIRTTNQITDVESVTAAELNVLDRTRRRPPPLPELVGPSTAPGARPISIGA